MKLRRFFLAFLSVFVLFVSSTVVSAQTPDQVADLYARLNRERTSRGKLPYALNSQLSQAAQAHANDMAATGKLSHTGSDGSTTAIRVARAGYGAYSWGYRVGENWAWYRDAATAMAMWMGSKPHRDNILHDVYRELGIGIAKGSAGGYIFVVDFGAQPNVLPFFVNDGAASASTQNVTLALYDEVVYDSSTKNIQHVAQVLISNQPDFAGATWQSFAPRIPWTLTAGNGSKTVYLKYKDSRALTTMSVDTIGLGTGGVALNPPPLVSTSTRVSATKTRTPTVTRTQTRTVRPSPSSTPTRKPSATPTRIATVTRTPRPSLTPVGGTSPGVRFGPQVAGPTQEAAATPGNTDPTEVPPTIAASATPDVDATGAPPPTAPAQVPTDDPADDIAPLAALPLQVAFVPTQLPALTASISQLDDTTVASGAPAPGAGAIEYNPLEPFAYGFLAVGLVTGAIAALKFLFRRR